MGRKLQTERKLLTAAKVKQTKEPGKYYDENGLYLRIKASGAKTWAQKIVIEEGSVNLASALLHLLRYQKPEKWPASTGKWHARVETQSLSVSVEQMFQLLPKL